MADRESRWSSLRRPHSSPVPCIVSWTPDLLVQPFRATGLRGGNQSPVWGEKGTMRKVSCALEIDGKRRILAILKSICVCSKGENEVMVVGGERSGGGQGVGVLIEERIWLQGLPPTSSAAAELF